MAEADADGEVEEDEVEVEECKAEEEVIEVLKVEDGEAKDDDFKLEELKVELVDNTDVAEVLELLLDILTVLLKSYKSSLFGPPQNSDRLPLQGILHPVKPSGAGPPPLEKTLPQSIKHV